MEEKKFNFLLDMDGVLCDFVSGVLDALNVVCNRNDTIIDYVIDFGEWKTYDYYGFTEKKFWDIIYKVPDFWIRLRPFTWTKQLYNKLKELGNVTIVTTPSEDPTCATQKLDWLYAFLDIKPSDVFVGGKKYLMAGNGILIDDNKTNVDEFIAAGGEAILVPSTWNTLDLTFEGVWSVIQNYLDTRNIGYNKAQDLSIMDPIQRLVKEGKMQFESGMVRDTNKDKPRFDLISPLDLPYEKQMLTRWAKLMAYGANHYEARNWEKASGQEELDRFRESAHRHFMQWFFGNDTGEDHAAAIYFNISGFEMVKYKMENEFKTVAQEDPDKVYEEYSAANQKLIGK